MEITREEARVIEALAEYASSTLRVTELIHLGEARGTLRTKTNTEEIFKLRQKMGGEK